MTSLKTMGTLKHGFGKGLEEAMAADLAIQKRAMRTQPEWPCCPVCGERVKEVPTKERPCVECGSD